MPKLTPKQERFIDEYLVDLNATKASVRAGYSKHTAQRIGSENLSKPLVAEAIAARRMALSAKTEISQTWVLSKLKSVAERCMQEEEVIDRHGIPTGEFVFQHNGANKALELIGRHLGMFDVGGRTPGEDDATAINEPPRV